MKFMQIKSYIAQGHRDRHTYVKAVIRNSELDTHVMMQIKLKIKVLSEKSQKQVRIRAKFCLSNSNTQVLPPPCKCKNTNTLKQTYQQNIY